MDLLEFITKLKEEI